MKPTMRFKKGDTFGLGPKADPVEKEKKKWISPAPTECDVCQREIHTSFVDGRIHRGPWACLCLSCHSLMGVGLGTGRGQQYEKQGDEWVKVDG